MKLKTCAVVLLSFVLLSTQLLAFNGQRKGFILGGGVGGGYLAYKEVGLDLNKFSLATNFKIGYAPSNSLEIYYVNSVSWFGYLSETFAIGASMVGLTKYFNAEGKGFFIFAGAGLSSLLHISGEGGSANGFGALGGLGYDISKHWSIQGDVLYTTMESGLITSVSARVTINILAF